MTAPARGVSVGQRVKSKGSLEAWRVLHVYPGGVAVVMEGYNESASNMIFMPFSSLDLEPHKAEPGVVYFGNGAQYVGLADGRVIRTVRTQGIQYEQPQQFNLTTFSKSEHGA